MDLTKRLRSWLRNLRAQRNRRAWKRHLECLLRMTKQELRLMYKVERLAREARSLPDPESQQLKSQQSETESLLSIQMMDINRVEDLQLSCKSLLDSKSLM